MPAPDPARSPKVIGLPEPHSLLASAPPRLASGGRNSRGAGGIQSPPAHANGTATRQPVSGEVHCAAVMQQVSTPREHGGGAPAVRSSHGRSRNRPEGSPLLAMAGIIEEASKTHRRAQRALSAISVFFGMPERGSRSIFFYMSIKMGPAVAAGLNLLFHVDIGSGGKRPVLRLEQPERTLHREAREASYIMPATGHANGSTQTLRPKLATQHGIRL